LRRLRKEQADARSIGPEYASRISLCHLFVKIIILFARLWLVAAVDATVFGVAERKVEDGVSQLRKAIAAEDALHYDEPPGSILPCATRLEGHAKHRCEGR
jgi:hypothetical protein